MAADAGDSAPEVAERQIGDGEPGESEDPSDKNFKAGNEERQTTNFRAEER